MLPAGSYEVIVEAEGYGTVGQKVGYDSFSSLRTIGYCNLFRITVASSPPGERDERRRRLRHDRPLPPDARGARRGRQRAQPGERVCEGERVYSPRFPYSLVEAREYGDGESTLLVPHALSPV